MPVALVTDSTASLPEAVARARGITVVPLQVVIGATSYDEGVEGGATPEMLAEALRAWTPVSTSLFYVDTLEYLRRGGRMGAAAALLGSALAVKPILKVDAGRIGPFERVRTSAKALGRLEELAVEAAGDAVVEVAVAHLASPDRATTLADRLSARLAEGLEGRVIEVGEIGAVLGAHVGPGMVAVCVARRGERTSASEDVVEPEDTAG